MHDPALLAAIALHPSEDTPRLAAADWYAERDDLLHEAQCRTGPAPVGLVFYGNGNGYWYGNGDWYGYGNGDGYGNGYGYGNGDGYGYGDGYGDGNGYGDGDGYGDGKLILGARVMPTVGGNWLIVLPHGWVIVGFVEEQTGPYQFRVVNAVVICRTGGVPWDELADGKRRNSATYRNWGTVHIGPQFVMSREWKGELPVAA